MDESNRDDQEIASLLRVAGAREPLPENLRDRWEAHFRVELAARQTQKKAESRSRVKLGRILALCATVAVMALGLTLLPDAPVESPATSIQLVHVSGDVRFGNEIGDVLTPEAGDALVTSTHIRTGLSGLVALRYNDHELRINGNSHLLLGAESFELLAGELYAADLLTSTRAAKGGLQIETAQGSVTDIGTQFTVAIVGEQTQATVRQGAILVRSGDTERTVQAPVGGALRSILTVGLAIDVRPVASRGQDWQWIHRAAPAYDIDGRTALEFLRWAARESGLQLRFTSPGAERYAKRTVLHGNLLEIDPQQAVEPILAGTDLTARVSDAGELIVAMLR